MLRPARRSLRVTLTAESQLVQLVTGQGSCKHQWTPATTASRARAHRRNTVVMICPAGRATLKNKARPARAAGQTGILPFSEMPFFFVFRSPYNKSSQAPTYCESSFHPSTKHVPSYFRCRPGEFRYTSALTTFWCEIDASNYIVRV